MKKLIILILGAVFVLSASEADAQTWSEWFRQKKTQKKYLLQQIAALKVYAGYAQKGYKIYQQGLGAIGSFTGGEFTLHGDFFASLETVRPEIRSYSKAAGIVAIQEEIAKDYPSYLRIFDNSDFLSAEEQHYIRSVYSRMMADLEAGIDRLAEVTAEGTLKMTDDERIGTIDGLYAETQEIYVFFRRFSEEAKSLALSREKEQKEIENSRVMHGITTEP
ncbi:hypothetical protein [Sphingobacterium siyangense]|uniref:hypothetical protein n=1 Tax=Sphingobacterium siyangense TaxID=459529 RepID=UPI00196240F8|nr:hypothetical protein [Sphingobacterium siyangense]QRY55582.1 hypothetical protein JVX97_16210 [Sphingobacterium siyangense]